MEGHSQMRSFFFFLKRAVDGGVGVSVLSHFCSGRLFVTPWTVAHQVSLSMGSLQARILEWVAIASSRGPSWKNSGLPHFRQILYCLDHQGSVL